MRLFLTVVSHLLFLVAICLAGSGKFEEATFWLVSAVYFRLNALFDGKL